MAARDDDFLGEGTAAAPQAAEKTAAQLAAEEETRRRRAALLLRMSAQQTGNINAQQNPQGRTPIKAGQINPATGQRYTGDERPNPGSFGSTVLPTLRAISRDPVTAGILAAPYGVLAAGAAAGGLGAGSAIGNSVGLAPQSAPFLIPGSGAAGAAGAGAAAAAGGGITAGQVIGGLAGAAGIGLSAAGIASRPGPAQQPPLQPFSPQTTAAMDATQAAALANSQNASGAAQRIQSVANQFAGTNRPDLAAGLASSPGVATRAPTVNQFPAVTENRPQVIQRDVSSNVQALANQFPGAAQQSTPNFAATGAAAANRAAPQIRESGAGQAAQQSALAAAQSFQPNDSGAAGIRAARADTSGAVPLSNFRTDQAGIERLDSFNPSNANTGIQRLNQFQSTGTQEGVGQLQTFNTTGTQQGVRNLQEFAPEESIQAARGLQSFRANEALQAAGDLDTFRVQNAGNSAADLQNLSTTNGNVRALNDYANEAQGPSAAQALLQSQSDKDTRTAIAIARSARGGPAAVAQAMRRAQSEGAAIQAETRGQAAALSAQENETFKTRQLAALSNAGSLISESTAQKLQAHVAAGQILSAADAQRLSAFQSAAAARVAAGGQRLSAQQSGAQVLSQADAQQLQSKISAGQLLSQSDAQLLQARVAAGGLLSQADAQKLSAYQAATQAQTAQDQQLLGAATAAGQLRSQADATRQTALANAANINLQGSAINQQGQIAATQAELAGSAQRVQALSIQGQISSDIRNADINVLKSNLDASLQQLNLNDTQVRAFAQIGEDARQANQNASLQAAQLGLNAAQVQNAVDLGWQQFAQSQLSNAQQVQLQQQALAQGLVINNQNNATSQSNQLIQAGGSLLVGAGRLVSDERAKKNIRPVSSKEVAQALRDSPGSEYEYTEPDKPGRAPGRHTTPMAQGLRKSKLFGPAVSASKDGTLTVDTGRLALAQHTAIAHLQREIDEIKKHRKGRKAEARA